MSFFSCLRVEVTRIFRSKITWLVIVLTLCSLLAGYSLYQPAVTGTQASHLIANPVLAGALIGAVLFALLTLFELNRVHESQMASLTDTIVSPIILNTARVVAVLMVATAAGLLTMVAYYPYTATKMGHIFEPELYFASFLILMLPSLWLGSLFAAVFYQITRRVDISFMLIAACMLLSMSQFFHKDFILRWANPSIPVYSDDFSNALALRMALYSRLFWLIVLAGLWFLSTLFIRRYEKGALGSLVYNMREFRVIPLLVVVFLASGVAMYMYQPFVNHSPFEPEFFDYDCYEGLFIISTHVDATPDVRRGTQHGTVTYRIRNENTEPMEQKLELNCGYTVHRMMVNGRPIEFRDLNNDQWTVKQITFMLPPEEDIELVVEYGGFPQLWSFLETSMNGDQISRHYIDLSKASFAPVLYIFLYYEEPPIITANITLPSNLTPVVMGGDVELLKANADGTKTWRAWEDCSLGLSLFAADYVRTDVQAKSMSAEFYYSRKHEEIMERANIKTTLAEVFDYCTEHIGPLFIGKDGKLKLVQTTAYMFGGYAAKDMSAISETSFSEDVLQDPWLGASASEVMAHEIIHQWWGLGAMFDDDYEGEWSSEGLTVYTTYRLMKEKYGDEYAKKNYIEVWQKAVEDRNRNFYHRHPEYLDVLPEKYATSIRMNESSVNRYCVMPLKILKAEKLVGGEERFDELMQQLYVSKGMENPPLLTYNDFVNICGLSKEALELD
ncbi:MAG: M1 family metallopeptidase [Firmicutes bacterium]|nr:M1 family metallopeptidase [Bacillota bacterium]